MTFQKVTLVQHFVGVFVMGLGAGWVGGFPAVFLVGGVYLVVHSMWASSLEAVLRKIGKLT